MPLELQPGETVLFPAPYIPTEHHAVVITTKRVVQYAPKGAFPVSEFEVAKVEFIGRMSERPYFGLAIALAILGLILFIAGAVKVLPPTLHAGAPKTEKKEDEAELTADGRLIEGKDADDEFPFYDKDIEKNSMKQKAEKLKKLKEIKPGIPEFTSDVKLGLLFWFLAVCALLPAHLLRKKYEHCIFCRVGENVHRIGVKNEMHQTMVLSVLQAAQQAGGK